MPSSFPPLEPQTIVLLGRNSYTLYYTRDHKATAQLNKSSSTYSDLEKIHTPSVFAKFNLLQI